MRENRRAFIVFIPFILWLFVVLLCVSMSRTDSEEAMAHEDTDESFLSVPILMYHSVCDNKKVTSDYRITPAQFEEDIKYLSEKGYTGIFVADLVAYVYEGVELPENPIIITLDDGYLNNMTNVMPILEKYDMCATISVVGKFTEDFSNTADANPLYAYLTWNDIKTLSESGRVEIGNHTYAMHELGERRGCAKIVGESDEKYDEALTLDLGKLQSALEEKSQVVPIVFTYPYGFISEESLHVIKKLGFLAALTCYEHINVITGEPEQLYKLGRFNRPANISTVEFMKKNGI